MHAQPCKHRTMGCRNKEGTHRVAPSFFDSIVAYFFKKASQLHPVSGWFLGKTPQLHPVSGRFFKKTSQLHPVSGRFFRKIPQLHPVSRWFLRKTPQLHPVSGRFFRKAPQLHPVSGRFFRKAPQLHPVSGWYREAASHLFKKADVTTSYCIGFENEGKRGARHLLQAVDIVLRHLGTAFAIHTRRNDATGIACSFATREKPS